MNSTNDIVWSSNASTTPLNPVAVLLESGNLVVKDGNDNDPDNFLWQSFDYPCNTFLPGDFTFQVDPHGFPQLFVKMGPEILYRVGSWNGLRWTGTTQLEPNPVYTYEFVSNEKEVFYRFDIRNRSVPSRMVVSPSGDVQRFTWIDRIKSWSSFFTTGQLDRCENYDLCGSYASCNINKYPDACECLKGFTPKSPGEWEILNWTEGCVRRASLNCNHRDGFLKHEAVKLPETSNSWVDNNISFAKCEKLCLNNCSCTAYANSDVREGGTRGCLLWFTDLLDIRELAANGQDLYVRVAASELEQPSEKKRVIIIVTCVVSAMGVLVLGGIIFMCKSKLRIQGKMDNSRDINDNNEESKIDEMELLIYDLNTLANATDNFADKNKLGEGGFGPVYKGILMEGQEIAIKRLSKCSGQGIDEFKNELKPNPVYTYEFVSNEKEVFYRFDIRNRSVPSRMVVSPSGDVQRFTWIDRIKSWSSFTAGQLDRCENYDLCGSYASCNINKYPDACECLKGFTPKSPEEWEILNWTEGCVRRASLNCNHNDGFLKHEAVKLPDTSNSWVDNNISFAKCKKLCLNNCSCTAYANSNVREGGTRGCLLWFSDLLDIRELAANGQDL
ncbi:hypothetical protein LWI28_016329 [Acer negundo]|uniref:non-specific serine/threonine protein kinase n=1 Tax=Acer negundo TaxID=4023 RepID=A0AAD5J6D6_ACENE|nr:hypothetical protein LWI28_016329 [Acer negundo]